MKAMVIFNPRSGRRHAPRIREIAGRIGRDLGWTVDLQEITGPGHGMELAVQAVREGYERVISVGGDGTNNAIARGLVGSTVPMGIVAMGSGNGYARSLGLPLDPEAALKHALTGIPALLDIGFLNDALFLGTAGIGFDARVADRFDKGKGRGMFGYASIIVEEIFGARPMPVRIRANGKECSENVLMLVFCNTREFGNGANISPSSKPDDGLAELRLVRKPSFLPLLRAFAQIYSGRADQSPYISNISTSEAHIRQGGTLAHLDGEPVEIGHEVHFRLEPKRLWVVR